MSGQKVTEDLEAFLHELREKKVAVGLNPAHILAVSESDVSAVRACATAHGLTSVTTGPGSEDDRIWMVVGESQEDVDSITKVYMSENPSGRLRKGTLALTTAAAVLVTWSSLAFL